MKRVFLAPLLALALFAPFSTASAQTVTDDGVLVYSGRETTRSAPFTLDPGNYAFNWTVEATSYSGRTACSTWLRGVNGTPDPVGQDLLINQIVWGQESGQSYVYGLPGGTYYYDASLCGNFTLTLQPT